MTSCRASPITFRPRTATADQVDAAGLRREPAAVDGLGDHVVQAHQRRRLERVVALQAGQLDDVLHQPGQAVGLVLHPAGEPAYGLRVVRRVDQGLGQQRHRADRGLELVADVGDEVPAYLVDPAGLGAVLDHDQHQGSTRAARPAPARRWWPSRAGREPAPARARGSRRRGGPPGPARAARRRAAAAPGPGRRSRRPGWTGPPGPRRRGRRSSCAAGPARPRRRAAAAGRGPRASGTCCSRSLTRNASAAAAPTSRPTTAASPMSSDSTP